MKKLYFLIALIGTIALMPINVSAQYYYSGGQQVPLGIDSLKVCLKFDDLITQQD